ncbi:hypothetical protein N9751_01525 [Alphaproteobacteria bacterium]|nr:hypothetical protein [Alphaproteobacteria bacterium]
MNKLKISFATLNLIFGLLLIYLFLTSEHVSQNLEMNLMGIGFLYMPIACLLLAYMLIKKITFFNKPLAVINVLMGFAHIQITYNLISNMSSINFTLNLALFTTYISIICLYISYKLYICESLK